MLSRIQSYLKFLLASTNAHGVQSPFVFDLVRKCFYDRRNHLEYKIVDEFRKEMSVNQNVIEVEDFGAGSTVFKSNRRKVSDIAKNAGISRKRARLLFRIVHYYNPENILELGTSLGIATAAMANADASITTIEGCKQTAAIAEAAFGKFGFRNVNLQIGSFDRVLPKFSNTKFDLIYFDGNHRQDATLNYFEQLLSTAHNDSIWILDDIHWSPEMESAWEIIKQHPAVTVTIDTWQWGFVFFRKEQAKEDFMIRV